MTGPLSQPNAIRLRAFTPARVGLVPTGVSQQTRDVLDFQHAHALARDAVHAELDAISLAAAIQPLTSREVLQLHSTAANRATYLQRPDLGRRLNDCSREQLAAHSGRPHSLAIVICDGLSALAVVRNAVSLLATLFPRIDQIGLGPICIVRQGRVAIGDEIGELLAADLALVLIGERPGLSAPDSLGAYITWMPRLGRTDAERLCISNIRSAGLRPSDAAAQIGAALADARSRRLTGVAHSGSRALPEAGRL